MFCGWILIFLYFYMLTFAFYYYCYCCCYYRYSVSGKRDQIIYCNVFYNAWTILNKFDTLFLE